MAARRAGSTRWNREVRARFFDHLAATCNIAASAAAAGMSVASAYAQQRRSAAFAQEWEKALAQGYLVLEMLLVGHALAGGGKAITHGAGGTVGPIDAELAFKLLAMRHGQTRPTRAAKTAGDREPRLADSDDTDRAILKRLAAIEKRRAAA